MTNYEIFKEILLILYYIASIGLVVGVFIGIKQLKVMKRDVETKNKRAAVDKSIEFLNWFATEFIPENSEKEKKLDKDKIIIMKNKEFQDFNINELAFLSRFKPEKITSSVKEKYRCEIVTLTNQLEFFSAAMNTGLADEQMAFNPLASTFCKFVEDNYDLYCYMRNGNEETLFNNTIDLYLMWKSRLNTIELVRKKVEIEEQLSKVTVKSIPILGKE
ncbi:hypothetical protein ACIQ1H_05130 [Lysinibacillus sp. NPDC097279]|uniref:DUF4760 domain-containing protein n=1 Tax=Lysinibacillus sp. NPDC097279 TaxID=3364143 RepID=UPI0038029F77